MNLLNSLNPQQLEAVKYTNGPTLIFAGAGSGKTKVLTHKIAYLIENKIVSPQNILAVTFTNKAAEELRQRVKNFVGKQSKYINVGTFHSVCAKILRRHIQHLNYSPNFTIYDEADQLSLLKKVIKDNEITLENAPPKAILSKISYLKNSMTDIEDFEPRKWITVEKLTKLIYPLYQNALRKANALDFDDLLIMPIKLFNQFPDILEKYRNLYKYILVDEYQDTNKPQFVFVNKLSQEHKNVCVVGDDDQSIYTWRGADVENILRFEKVYTDCKIFKLEQNYRSTKNIIKAASAVVQNNIYRSEKILWADNPEGELLICIEARNEYDEASRVAEQIQKEILHNKRNFKDFAILYRTNAQSRVLEEILRRNNIVYTIIGGVKFYERKEVKDLLSYLRVFSNPSDDISSLRIINTPTRGIGKSTVAILENFAKSKNISLYDALAHFEFIGLNKRGINTVKEFYQLLQQLRDLKRTVSFEEWSRILVDALELRKYYKEIGGEEGRQRLANIDELLNDISDYCRKVENPTLESYLEEISLITDIDTWEDKKNAVSLMTLHSAKGLEFPVVFICGLNQGLFPLERDVSDKQIEEERRLFYVGLTRAKEKVFLSTTQERNIAGETKYQMKSIFLKEIPDELIQECQTYRKPSTTRRKYRKIKENYASTNVAPEVSFLTPGSIVTHKIFGVGKVLEVNGYGENARLVIYFNGVGEKTIVAKFVQLIK